MIAGARRRNDDLAALNGDRHREADNADKPQRLGVQFNQSVLREQL